ncbi:MAG: sulfur oxidation c-type cytochrome SoxA [Casimicrobiaceae bacterium]
MTRKIVGMAALMLGSALAFAPGAGAQQKSAVDDIARYRELLQDGNPAELWELRGELLWKTKRGPNNVSLEQCDLGKGPGVVKGAYASLPKYFADTDHVMDLETRLVHCMVTLQGYSSVDAKKQHFGNGNEHKSDNEALVAYITAESKGVVMNVSLAHPKEMEAYRLGKAMFFHRGGPHDFACATCHGDTSKRIRLQDLPNLLLKSDAQRAYTTWPAYRVSQGELRTFQWRLNDCFRQQRFPELEFTSEASIALTTFLAYNSNGGKYDAPAIKR